MQTSYTPSMNTSSNDGDVDIRPWIPNKYLQKGGTTVLIGKRRSGKSTTILNIMMHMQNMFEFGFIFCGSASTREQYSRHVPHDFISDTMSLDLINKLMNFQDRRRSLRTIRPIFIIIDDFAFNRSVLRSSTMYKLFANGRHYQIFFVLGMQYSLSIGPDARGNIDTLILHRDVTIQNQQKLYDNYNISFKNFEEFRGVLLDVTRQHRVLVFQKDLECVDDFPVFHWKGKHPIPPFKISPHLQWWNTGKSAMLAAIDTVLSGTLLRDPTQNGRYMLSYKNKERRTGKNNAIQVGKQIGTNLFVCRPDTKRNVRERTRSFNVIAPKSTLPPTREYRMTHGNAPPRFTRHSGVRNFNPPERGTTSHQQPHFKKPKSVSLKYTTTQNVQSSRHNNFSSNSSKPIAPSSMQHASFLQPKRNTYYTKPKPVSMPINKRNEQKQKSNAVAKPRGMASFFLGI